VIVGEEKVKFLVHESILSRFVWFEKCLSSGMKEQGEKEINLPEDNPEAMAILVEWMYASTVSSDRSIWQLARGYFAADKYSIPDLQNAIMDRILQIFRDAEAGFLLASPAWVHMVWKETLEGCMLRGFAMDYLHYSLSRNPVPYDRPSQPRLEFLKAELEELMEDREIALELLWMFAYQGTRRVPDPTTYPDISWHVLDSPEVLSVDSE
jgi:hypothetical protein